MVYSSASPTLEGEREGRTVELKHEPRETRNRGTDHVRTATSKSSTDHLDELLHRRSDRLVHPVLHSSHLVPLDRSSSDRHLRPHLHKQVVGRRSCALVGFLGAEDGLRDEGGDVVESVGRKEGNESRQKESSVL